MNAINIEVSRFASGIVAIKLLMPSTGWDWIAYRQLENTEIEYHFTLLPDYPKADDIRVKVPVPIRPDAKWFITSWSREKNVITIYYTPRWLFASCHSIKQYRFWPERNETLLK